MPDEASKAKAEAKAEEAKRLEDAKKGEPGPEPKKRGPGRPPGTSLKDKPEGAAGPVTRKKRKPPEAIEDTRKALQQSYRDQQVLVKKHLKKHPNAKVNAVDPFTAGREPLKLDEHEVIGFTHTTFSFLGNVLRVPSAIPDDEKLDDIGKYWARALPYMNIDPGRFYIAFAAVTTGAVVISMCVLSVARLLGKYEDPILDNPERPGEMDSQIALLDESGVAQLERQVDHETAKAKAAIDRRKNQLAEEKKKGNASN